MKLVSVRLGKDARSGEAKSYDAANVVGRVPAKYVTDADIAILAHLAAIKRKDWGGGYDLSGSSCSELFDRIVATGRARWCVIDAPPLVAAGTRAATIGWDVLGDGTSAPWSCAMA